MYLFIYRKLIYSKKLFLQYGIMFMLAVLITLTRTASIHFSIIEYAKAGLDYQMPSYFSSWAGYTESFFAAASDWISVFTYTFSDLFSKILMPLILAFSGIDLFYMDVKSRLCNVIFTKRDRNMYVLTQAAIVYLHFLCLEMFFLMTQLICSMFCNELILKISFPDEKNVSVLVFGAIIRLAFYYAGIAFLAYALSNVFVKQKAVLFLFPLVYSLGSSVLLINRYHNDPLALAYMESGLAVPDMFFYYLFTVGTFFLSWILILFRIWVGYSKNAPESMDIILMDTE